MRATTTEDSTPGAMEVRYLLIHNVTGGAQSNRIELNLNLIEADLKLGRIGTKSASNRNRIKS